MASRSRLQMISLPFPLPAQGDVHVRALKFLSTMMSRDVAQKRAFLQDLPNMCAHFDRRVLRYMVRSHAGAVADRLGKGGKRDGRRGGEDGAQWQLGCRASERGVIVLHICASQR